MEPSEFLFLILPLGALIFILVSLALYLAKKEEIIYDEEVEMLNELLMAGIVDRENFASALHGLLQDGIINRDAYEWLGKLLQGTFKKRTKTCARKYFTSEKLSKEKVKPK